MRQQKEAEGHSKLSVPNLLKEKAGQQRLIVAIVDDGC